MAARMLEWTGLKGGKIGVGFDDGHFGPERMRAGIDSAGDAYPEPARRGAAGPRFSFGREGTGHLAARFQVGNTIYRSGGPEGELRRL